MLTLSLERVGEIPALPVPTLNPRVEVWRDNVGLFSAYGEVLELSYPILVVSVPFNIRLRPASAELFEFAAPAPAYIEDRERTYLPAERAPLFSVCVLRRDTEAT